MASIQNSPTLILEDDARFNNQINWINLIQEFKNLFENQNIDILQLGWVAEAYNYRYVEKYLDWFIELRYRKNIKLSSNVGVGRLVLNTHSFRAGSHAYFISPRMAKFLSGLVSQQGFAVDDYLTYLALSSRNSSALSSRNSDPFPVICRLNRNLIKQEYQKVGRKKLRDSDISSQNRQT